MEPLADNFALIESRIEAACRRSGRSRSEVTLVAVSKTFPLERIAELHAMGQMHFGENKVQELERKVDALPGKRAGGDIVWHAIGHLQRNKVKNVVPRADLFHALDSLRLAREIEKRCREHDQTFDCLVQVNVSGEESKFGLDPEEVGDFISQLSEFPRVRAVGLMTLAAPVPDPELVRPQFRLLRQLRDRLAARHAEIRSLSMGMSGDFEVAIEEGATHVRIGSAIFGARSYP